VAARALSGARLGARLPRFAQGGQERWKGKKSPCQIRVMLIKCVSGRRRYT
jgi:hypothetical protein